MTTILTNNLYISSQLHRWLKWIVEMERQLEPKTAPTLTSDSAAEQILRDYILSAYPCIEQLEGEYFTARNKLDSETVKKLKEQTKEQSNEQPSIPTVTG